MKISRRRRKEEEALRQADVHAKRLLVESSCLSKKRYATEDEAIDVAKKRRAWGHETSPLWTYWCTNCEGWHLTRVPHHKPPAA